MVNEGTIREKILRILLEAKEPLDAYMIALEAGLDPSTSEKEVYEHLIHIAKTTRRRSKGKLLLYMIPPRCRDCGYVFKDLRKPRKPSRCPRCKSQRITPPLFKIMET